MKMITTILLLAGAASPALGQGFSYDMKTSRLTTDSKTGATTTVVYSAGHAQFSNGNMRIDYTGSIRPGGMMGAGSYMIVRKASPITTFVDPAKKEYMEINREEMAKDASNLQKSIGGMAKTEISGVKVEVEDLGAGESIEGNATEKYRMTSDYTMTISVMGHRTSTTQHSVTDLWVAPALDGFMSPMARQSSAAGGSMSALTEATTKAFAKIKSGAVVRTVMATESGEEDDGQTSTITMQISNLKRASISPGVFEMPTGYTKKDGLAGVMGARPPR